MTNSVLPSAARILERCDALARCSEQADALTRVYLSAEQRAANELILPWMRDAGKYDGMLGVVAAIECVASLHASGYRLPFAVEVVGFADEEGVRFNATL